jgi:hypothetical protein
MVRALGLSDSCIFVHSCSVLRRKTMVHPDLLTLWRRPLQAIILVPALGSHVESMELEIRGQEQ